MSVLYKTFRASFRAFVTEVLPRPGNPAHATHTLRVLFGEDYGASTVQLPEKERLL